MTRIARLFAGLPWLWDERRLTRTVLSGGRSRGWWGRCRRSSRKTTAGALAAAARDAKTALDAGWVEARYDQERHR